MFDPMGQEQPDQQFDLMEMIRRQQMLLAQQQQQQMAMQQPQMNQLYQQVAQQQADPARQAQLAQFEGQMPDDLARTLRDRMYGKGTIGKILEAVAAAGGARPNFEKAGLERYKIQREQVLSDQAQQTKLAQAEIGATQRAQTAMQQIFQKERARQDARENNLMKNAISEHKNEISQLKIGVDKIIADNKLSFEEKRLLLAEKKQQADALNQRFLRAQSVFQGSGLGATMGRASTMSKEFEDAGLTKDAEAINNAMLPYLQGAKTEAEQKLAGQSRVGTRKQMVVQPDGSRILVDMPSSSGPANPFNPSSFDQIIQGLPRNFQRPAENAPGNAPQTPQAQSPMAQAPMGTPQPAAMQQRPSVPPAIDAYMTGKPLPKGTGGITLPESGLKRLDPYTTVGGKEPNTAIQTYYKRTDGAQEVISPAGLPGRKVLDAKIVDSNNRELVKDEAAASKVVDLYARGIIDRKQSMLRRGIALFVKDSSINTIDRLFGGGGPDDQDFDTSLRQLRQSQKAEFLQGISGAQVSDAEYKRLAQVYSMDTDSPEAFTRAAIFHAIMKPALRRLDAAGLMQDTRNGALVGTTLERVAKRQTDEIIRSLQFAKSLPQGSKKQREIIEQVQKTLASPDQIAAEVLRQGYQPKDGWIQVDTPTHKFHIYVPSASPQMEDIRRKNGSATQKQKAKQEMEDAWKRIIGQEDE